MLISGRGALSTTIDARAGKYFLDRKFKYNLFKLRRCAESFALNGAVKTAKISKTKFMIEMHSPPELTMEDNAERVLSWCKNNQYTPFYMKEAIELLESKQIANRGKCHLLLIPVGESYPDYLKNIKQGSPLPQVIN